MILRKIREQLPVVEEKMRVAYIKLYPISMFKNWLSCGLHTHDIASLYVLATIRMKSMQLPGDQLVRKRGYCLKNPELKKIRLQ